MYNFFFFFSNQSVVLLVFETSKVFIQNNEPTNNNTFSNEYQSTPTRRELGRPTTAAPVDISAIMASEIAESPTIGDGPAPLPPHRAAQPPSTLPLGGGVTAAGSSSGPVAALKRREADRHSVELATPVLDNANPFDALHPPLMPLSMVSVGWPMPSEECGDNSTCSLSLSPPLQAWLLACALPPLYARPQPATLPGTVAAAGAAASNSTTASTTAATVAQPAPGAAQLASAAFMARLLSAVPSHWTLLYDSRQDGVGANRFLHHVLGYRGPTLCMLRADNEQVFCVASAAEWRESTMYQGAAECAVLQVMPR